MLKTAFTVVFLAISSLSSASAQTVAPSPSPTPSAAPSPVVTYKDSGLSIQVAPVVPFATITPPAGWQRQPNFNVQMYGFQGESAWVSAASGTVFTAHVPSTAPLTPSSLTTMATGMRQGLVAVAGADSIKSFGPAKVCGGKQDAYFANVVFTMGQQHIVEYMYMTAAKNAAYIAEYVHGATVRDDPAALAAIKTLCSP